MSLDTGRRMLNAELSPIQGKIKLLLVMAGLKPNEVTMIPNGGGDGVMRYDYWKHVDLNYLDYVAEHTGVRLQEVEWHEEDCGWLYCYRIPK